MCIYGAPIVSQEVAEGLSLGAERATGCLRVLIHRIYGFLQRNQGIVEVLWGIIGKYYFFPSQNSEELHGRPSREINT